MHNDFSYIKLQAIQLGVRIEFQDKRTVRHIERCQDNTVRFL